MTILVTNDDGIDAPGLHALVRHLAEVDEVVVVAPEGEQSGASAAIGALSLGFPEVSDAQVPGATQAYAVAGAPALCTYYAMLGAFGTPPDLVVSGINPGWNVGRAVYHSGTIGAALTARSGGISGVAISQHAGEPQHWDTAAAAAASVATALLEAPPAEPAVANVNVGNIGLDDVIGFRTVGLSDRIPFAMTAVKLRETGPGTYAVDIERDQSFDRSVDVDTGAVNANYIALSWLGPIGVESRAESAVHRALSSLVA